MNTWSLAVDRPVLVSNLLSGAVWLLVLTALGAWPLAVIGMLYVVPASLVLAAAFWAWVIGTSDYGRPALLDPSALSAGLVVGTACFVAWQIMARAFRAQYLRSRKDREPQTAAGE